VTHYLEYFAARAWPSAIEGERILDEIAPQSLVSNPNVQIFEFKAALMTEWSDASTQVMKTRWSELMTDTTSFHHF
jgi:hypothetical protein